MSSWVVTDAVKQEIENIGFKGVLFLEVQKELIVKKDWHTWDLSAPNPPRYPRGGDPGNYLIGKHSEEASEQMGRLWNLALAPGAVMERFEIGLNKLTDIEDRYVSGTWNGADFFAATLNAHIYLSDRAAEWLRHNFPEWIDIQSVRLAR